MKRFSDLSMERLQKIYEVVKAERPVLVQELKEDHFETPEDKAAVVSGVTIFIGSEVLKDEYPLNSQALNISHDICYFLIMGLEPTA